MHCSFIIVTAASFFSVLSYYFSTQVSRSGVMENGKEQWRRKVSKQVKRPPYGYMLQKVLYIGEKKENQKFYFEWQLLDPADSVQHPVY